MSIAESRVATAGARGLASEEAVLEFESQFRGAIVHPDDPSYDEKRRVWNGMIDRHPALIARATGTADVIVAVNFARKHGLPLSVRGGGHNVAGHAVIDSGLMIDLSGMTGIQVDAPNRRVRVQPGADWGDLDHETQVHGLVTPGGQVSTTGVAGFTLGGGMGFLRRKWGLAADNLVAVEIVTASGQVLTASEDEHPDLFWAVRGGGGNFGIVTWFEFQLYPLGPEVYLAAPIYPLDQGVEVLRSWRDFITRAPDEVTSDALLWGMPPLPMVPEEMRGAPIIVIPSFYAGPVEEARRALQPVMEFGTPVGDLSGAKPYTAVQSDFDVFFPDGLQYYWKSLYANMLSDDVIDAIVARTANRPSPQTLLALRSLGGAMGRVPEDGTAYGNRDAMFNLSVDATWADPEQSPEMIAWARETWAEIRDLTGGGVYVNFAGFGEEGTELARAGYGRNYERLVDVKRRYDPDNLFRGNINIVP